MSLMRFRLARDALQFGNEDGYCALKDQYRILWQIRIARTSGLARIFRFPPAEPRFDFSIKDGEFAGATPSMGVPKPPKIRSTEWI
jgi:hypothetical protein